MGKATTLISLRWMVLSVTTFFLCVKFKNVRKHFFEYWKHFRDNKRDKLVIHHLRFFGGAFIVLSTERAFFDLLGWAFSTLFPICCLFRNMLCVKDLMTLLFTCLNEPLDSKTDLLLGCSIMKSLNRKEDRKRKNKDGDKTIQKFLSPHENNKHFYYFSGRTK